MEQRIFGYARVSSSGQKLDRQLLELKKYVLPENIVVDKISGKSLDRPGYQALKGALGLRKGDVLVIHSLDRLSRNKSDIYSELKWFQENDIRLKVLDLPTTLVDMPENQQWIAEMINNILIEVMASFAEHERIVIRKRQKEGIEAARKNGKHLGRPPLDIPDNFPEIYQQWKQEKITVKKAAQKLNISSSSFYRIVKKYESDNASKSL